MRNRALLGAWTGIATLSLLACVKDGERTRLPDGSYHLVCRHELAQCLQPIEELCKDYGYDVARASERSTRRGPTGWAEDPSFETEAVVRCRTGHALFGRSSDSLPWPAEGGDAAISPSGTPSAEAGADGIFQHCECAPAVLPHGDAGSAADAGSPDGA
jgi:hypothetical protein